MRKVCLLQMPGNETELNQIFSVMYETLKQAASSIRRRHGHASLETTAIVHEAWLKLRQSTNLAYESETHFKAIAARVMRQILIDLARRGSTLKRGRLAPLTQLDVEQVPGARVGTGIEVLDLDEALNELATVNERQAKVVEYRYFGSMTIAETAEALSISEASAERDWRVAKAWLAFRLNPSREGRR